MSATISFIGIIIGVLFFVLMCCRGNNLCVSAALAALVIILFNLGSSENGVLGDITGFWVTGVANALKAYLLVFAMGGIFGKIMDASGATKRIALTLLHSVFKKFRDQKLAVTLFLSIMYLIFTYVGVHGFLIVFLMVSLARELLQANDLPWRFYCYGSAGILPGYYLIGSVSSVNAVGASITGGNAASGAPISIVYCIIYLITLVFLIKFDIKYAAKKGENFADTGVEIMKLDISAGKSEDELPSFVQAIIPMLVMIIVAASGVNVVIALTVGIVLSIVCLWKYIKTTLKSNVSVGATQTFPALINVCGAAALGATIRNVAGYQVISTALGSVTPLLGGVLLCIVGTLCTGSSSSSLSAFGPTAFEYFTAAGVSSGTAHRLILFGTNWIYPPHNPGAVNASATAKVPYKDAVLMYMKASAICNTVPLIICIILVALKIF